MVGDVGGIAHRVGPAGIAELRGDAQPPGKHLDVEVILVVVPAPIAIAQGDSGALLFPLRVGARLQEDEAHAIQDAAFQGWLRACLLRLSGDARPDLLLEKLRIARAQAEERARQAIRGPTPVGALVGRAHGRRDPLRIRRRVARAAIAAARTEATGDEEVEPGVELGAQLGIERLVVQVAARFPPGRVHLRQDLRHV